VTGIIGDHRPATGVTQELRPEDPHRVGAYWLLARLGSGGMGQVFLGRSPGGRLVAVKVVRAELAEQVEFRSRFAREVAAARQVSGLFTASVVDADVSAPTPWLATAYVAGPSLADTIASHGPLPAPSVLALAAGLAEGLGAIHAAGIVHRDLKPSNVLLSEDGPRIIDFGIARAAEATMLTGTGVVFGSPSFMSPEQARGNRVGPPSDVFSLGAVLAFAATGQGPFGSGSGPTMMYRVVFTPPDLSGLPAGIRPLVERCLAKDPEQRPTTQQFLAGLNTARPEAGWLPGPVTRTFPAYLPAEGGPVAPTTADDTLLGPVAEPGTAPRPGRAGRLGLAGVITAVALLAVYLVLAMLAHLPPFGQASYTPSSPAPATTAPASTGTRSSPATTPPATTPPATSPVPTTPVTTPPTTPVTTPPTTPVTTPPTTPVTTPPTTPVTTSPVTNPVTSTAVSPEAPGATSPAASGTTSPAAQLGASSPGALWSGNRTKVA
jgi:serine/threonine protein kinase